MKKDSDLAKEIARQLNNRIEDIMTRFKVCSTSAIYQSEVVDKQQETEIIIRVKSELEILKNFLAEKKKEILTNDGRALVNGLSVYTVCSLLIAVNLEKNLNLDLESKHKIYGFLSESIAELSLLKANVDLIDTIHRDSQTRFTTLSCVGSMHLSLQSQIQRVEKTKAILNNQDIESEKTYSLSSTTSNNNNNNNSSKRSERENTPPSSPPTKKAKTDFFKTKHKSSDDSSDEDKLYVSESSNSSVEHGYSSS